MKHWAIIFICLALPLGSVTGCWDCGCDDDGPTKKLTDPPGTESTHDTETAENTEAQQDSGVDDPEETDSGVNTAIESIVLSQNEPITL